MLIINFVIFLNSTNLASGTVFLSFCYLNPIMNRQENLEFGNVACCKFKGTKSATNGYGES